MPITILLALLLAAPEPYGQIGRMMAKPDQGAALAAAIGAGCRDMAGCRAYLVARDAANPDAVWVSEEWDSRAAHDAALALPRVRAAIAAARPLIAGMDSGVETVPLAPR